MSDFIGRILSYAFLVLIDCALWNYIVAPEWGLDTVRFRAVFPAFFIIKSAINMFASAWLPEKEWRL
jgi:hypothetical protein